MFSVLKAQFNFGISSHIVVSDSPITETKIFDIDSWVYLPGFQVNAIFVYA